jgi:UMF1 family MFS transporter
VTAFLAPLLVGAVTSAMNSQRAGFASLTILMVVGFVGLLFVKEEQSVAHDKTASE